MLNDRKVMIVEDEVFLALDLQDHLESLGLKVVGLAHTLDDALSLAETIDIDFAVLDINLRGEKSLPVARRLRERDVPFLFVTGYDRSGLDPDLKDAVVLSKPLSRDHLETAIEMVVGSD